MSRAALSLALCLIGVPALAQSPLQRIDSEVDSAIKRGELPGAVVLILHKGEVIYRKAYGNRSREPLLVPNSVESVYDLASLTKPVATTTSIFMLLERGRLKLDDPVAKHWPAFGANSKDKVTIEQCLLHVSGLIADNPVGDYEGGTVKALEQIAGLKLETEPGTKFRYSDVGFITLGRVVEIVSGMPLDEFAKKNVFEPLDMKQTSFHRGAVTGDKLDRLLVCAPTTKEDGKWLTGVVHDPRSRKMDGVAGHAGLFSTADDLAIFCRLILGHGELNGTRILKPESVRQMTEACQVPGGRRTRGWDCDTSYSAIRGTLFPKGRSFGHTGFTGTSIWIDPASQAAVIFLSNRVHPEGKGNVTKLRGLVSTLAAEAVGIKPGTD
jgi:CubicO group peptidase (beta-lactamase class C family)